MKMSVKLFLLITQGLLVSKNASVIKQDDTNDIKKGLLDLNYESVPADAFLTLLGPDLSSQLYSGKKEYHHDALVAVIKKLMDQVDIDGDKKLSPEELGKWFRKNTVINQASEIKYMLQTADTNADGLITFEEFMLNSPSVSIPLRGYFRNNYLNQDNTVHKEKLIANMEAANADEETLASSLKYSYDLFQAADSNKNGMLDWKEYVKFAMPEYFPETQPLVKRLSKLKRESDKDGDGKYTLDEFQVYFSKNIKHPEFLPKSVREPQAMFLHCDRNKNGFLEYEESDECVRPLLDYQTNIEWLLEDTDTSGDKHLTLEEILSAFHHVELNDSYFDPLHDEL